MEPAGEMKGNEPYMIGQNNRLSFVLPLGGKVESSLAAGRQIVNIGGREADRVQVGGGGRQGAEQGESQTGCKVGHTWYRVGHTWCRVRRTGYRWRQTVGKVGR